MDFFDSHRFDFSVEEVREAAAQGRLLSAEIEFNRSCNYRCPYCYAAGQYDRAALEPEIARNHVFINREPAKWARNVGYLRSAILDGHWHDSCIDILCQRLRVGAEERARYFGE